MIRTIRAVRAPGLRAFAGIAVCLAAAVTARGGVNEWTTTGPWAGAVPALVADPTNPQVVYAAAQYAGVFRSTDGGQTWTTIDTGLPARWITGLAIDPTSPSTLYASTYSTFVAKSTDRGDHWVSQDIVNPTSAYEEAYAIAVDPQAPSTVYAATLAGVWRTDDGGCSWNAAANEGLPPGQFGITSLGVSPADGRILFANMQGHGLFRSIDGGDQWTSVLFAPLAQNVSQVAVNPADPLVAWAAANSFNEITGESSGAVFRSADGGVTWDAVATLPSEAYIGVAIDPFGPGVYVSSMTGGIRVSTDSGATWSPVNVGLPSIAPSALVPGAAAGLWFAGSAGNGVFRTTDGGATWTGPGEAFAGLLFGWVVVDPAADATLWYANPWGGGAGVFRSLDAGATWANVSTDLPTGRITAMTVQPGSPETVYVCLMDRGGIYRSTDAGASWTATGALPAGAAIDATEFVVPPTDAGRVYVLANHLYFSDDGGDSWAPASSGTYFVDWMMADATVDGRLYGLVDGLNQVSTDHGATWSPSDTGLGGAQLTAFAQSPTDPNLMLGGGGGNPVTMIAPLYRSADRGASWQPSFSGMPQTNGIFSIVFDPANPSTAYAATNLPLSPDGRAVYVSTDAGLTWSPYDRGLPTVDNDNGSSLAIASDGSLLHLAGFGSVFHIHRSATPPPSIAGVAPPSGPTSGDSLVIVSGTGFASVVGLFFGQTAAADFAVVDDTHIAAITPAGAAGAVAVKVVTGEPQQDSLRAFVFDFADVPPASPFHESVVALTQRAVTGGCGGGNFCPGTPLNRGQAAVQIEKAMRGAGYPFDPVFGGPNQTLPMADVDRCSGFGPYIQQFLLDQITAGCGYPDYCPLSPLTRAQMMVFLLRAEHGPGYLPPPATGTVFGDVPADSFAADYIEAAAQEGITGGCGGGNFCPENPVTRGQAAALIVKTFPSAP